MEGNSGRSGGASGGRGRSHGRGGGERGDDHNQGGVGRGNHTNQLNQGGGRGWDAPHRGAHHQPPALQQLVSRPPVQGNRSPAQQALGYRPPQTPPTEHPRQQRVGLAGGSASRAPSSSSSTPVVDEDIIHEGDLDHYHCSCYLAFWKTLQFSFQ
ncbi:hypothetical protein CDL12_04567 [Handroanthus impetiginosus]|uniref:Uncharacterized protein n=1 Tax=Handroanthus impetiginosus TaxID=429701 RepID=A0A2G9HZ09_9LAMI|nr:hypothetical protein CDL12_04567 [Handroanthus impetiginosus]